MSFHWYYPGITLRPVPEHPPCEMVVTNKAQMIAAIWSIQPSQETTIRCGKLVYKVLYFDGVALERRQEAIVRQLRRSAQRTWKAAA